VRRNVVEHGEQRGGQADRLEGRRHTRVGPSPQPEEELAGKFGYLGLSRESIRRHSSTGYHELIDGTNDLCYK
jgi:hypothetical protein